MDEQCKRIIQEMLAPAFNCNPCDIEVDDGQAFVKAKQNVVVKKFEWTTDVLEPRR